MKTQNRLDKKGQQLRHSAPKIDPSVPSTQELEVLKSLVSELQGELAGLSSNGKVVQVRESGHFIQVDQPQAVIEAIREVVAAE